MSQCQPLIMLGAGGHAKVLLDLAKLSEFVVIGVCDPKFSSEELSFNENSWRAVPILEESKILAADPGQFGLINGIGDVGKPNGTRAPIYHRFRSAGFNFPALIHPSAYIASTAELANGVQVMAGAVIQTDSIIGENTVINTGAIIEHDCRLGKNVHIAPGAKISGGVSIGDNSFLGIGSCVVQGVVIGSNCIIGAGSVVIKDFFGPGTAVGNPARLKERK